MRQRGIITVWGSAYLIFFAAHRCGLDWKNSEKACLGLPFLQVVCSGKSQRRRSMRSVRLVAGWHDAGTDGTCQTEGRWQRAQRALGRSRLRSTSCRPGWRTSGENDAALNPCVCFHVVQSMVVKGTGKPHKGSLPPSVHSFACSTFSILKYVVRCYADQPFLGAVICSKQIWQPKPQPQGQGHFC